jgi:tetratricopeptide (TPR) repeat protein
MNEAMLNKANQYISGNDFKRAEGLYKLLLENKFKRDIIYLNIGVFHYETKNFDLAAENFKQSNNETPSVRAISYLALALKEKGKRLEAIKELETGIKLFPQDKELWGLYTKLKGESAQQ